MNLEDFREYCLGMNGATEGTPFGPDTIVFKVVGKIFALTDTNRIPSSANLKCDPERAIRLRNEYKAISPGYHMNKLHWNTVLLESELDDRFIKELIEHSYELVKSGLSKSEKETLGL